MKANIEDVRAIKDELSQLLQANWDESGWYQDRMELDVDWETYFRLQEQGNLVIYTLREEQELVGYCIWISSPFLHSKGKFVGDLDTVYITPKARRFRVAYTFLKGVFEHFISTVDFMNVHMKVGNNCKRLMEGLGMELMEYKYTKAGG